MIDLCVKYVKNYLDVHQVFMTSHVIGNGKQKKDLSDIAQCQSS